MKSSVHNLVVNDFSIFNIFVSADIITKVIIIVLIGISIWSWTIFISKLLTILRIKKNMDVFKAKFNHERHLHTLYKSLKKDARNPFSVIFESTMSEVESKEDFLSNSERLYNIKKSSQISYNEYMLELQKTIPVLGTIASVSPFVGLLGTIIGVVNSFESIAFNKSANISVVAPGVAEALFLTALGLFVAIPSLVFFNYLVNTIENIESRSESFIEELNLIIFKIFSKD